MVELFELPFNHNISQHRIGNEREKRKRTKGGEKQTPKVTTTTTLKRFWFID